MSENQITGSQVTIYDVQNDEWIGKPNNLHYISRLGNRRMLCIRHNGDLVTSAEPKTMKSHITSMPVVEKVDNPVLAKIVMMATYSAMEAAMSDMKLAFFQKLSVDEEFVSVELIKHGQCFHASTLFKSDYDCKEKYGFAHRKMHNGVKSKNSSWYGGHNGNAVFMSTTTWSALEDAFSSAARRDDLSMDTYHRGYGFVNVALVRIAQLMGDGAKVTPCDPITKIGQVQLGSMVFTLKETSYMDLSLSVDGTQISIREDICSVPEVISKNEAAIIPQTVNVCTLSCAAFEMLQEYKASKKRKKVA